MITAFIATASANIATLSERHASPDREMRDLLQFAAARINLSARACRRILPFERAIAAWRAAVRWKERS